LFCLTLVVVVGIWRKPTLCSHIDNISYVTVNAWRSYDGISHEIYNAWGKFKAFFDDWIIDALKKQKKITQRTSSLVINKNELLSNSSRQSVILSREMTAAKKDSLKIAGSNASPLVNHIDFFQNIHMDKIKTIDSLYDEYTSLILKYDSGRLRGIMQVAETLTKSFESYKPVDNEEDSLVKGWIACCRLLMESCSVALKSIEPSLVRKKTKEVSSIYLKSLIEYRRFLENDLPRQKSNIKAILNHNIYEVNQLIDKYKKLENK